MHLRPRPEFASGEPAADNLNPQSMSQNRCQLRWLRLFGASLALASVAAVPLAAQPLDMAPIQVFAHGRYDGGNGFADLLIGTQRDMPVYHLLPQVTADSYFELIRIVAGVQVDNDEKKERLRYRATAIETIIQKSPWASRFTFLDYDATGMEDLDANWISLSVGPGIHIGDEYTQFVVRAQGHGAFNTFRFGDILFEDLGADAGDTRTGLGYGLAGHASLVLVNRLELRGEYQRSWLSSESTLRRDELSARVEVNAGGGWRISGIVDSVRGEISELSMRRTAFGLGLSYTAGDTTY